MENGGCGFVGFELSDSLGQSLLAVLDCLAKGPQRRFLIGLRRPGVGQRLLLRGELVLPDRQFGFPPSGGFISLVVLPRQPVELGLAARDLLQRGGALDLAGLRFFGQLGQASGQFGFAPGQLGLPLIVRRLPGLAVIVEIAALVAQGGLRLFEGLAIALQLGRVMLNLGALPVELGLLALELGAVMVDFVALALDVLALAVDLVVARGELLLAIGQVGPLQIVLGGGGLLGQPLRSLGGQFGFAPREFGLAPAQLRLPLVVRRLAGLAVIVEIAALVAQGGLPLLEGLAIAFQLGGVMLDFRSLLLKLDLLALELGALLADFLAPALDVLALAVDLVVARGELLLAIGPVGALLIVLDGAGLLGEPLRSLGGQVGRGPGQCRLLGGQACLLGCQRRLVLLERGALAFDSRPTVGQRRSLLKRDRLFLGKRCAGSRERLLLASDFGLLDRQGVALG